MHHDPIDELLRKYLDGTCSEQERQVVDLWLMNRGHDETNEVNLADEANVKAQLFNTLQRRINKEEFDKEEKSIRLRAYKRYLAPVAAAVAALFIGVAFYLDKEEQTYHTNFKNSKLYSSAVLEEPKSFKITAAGKDYMIDSLPKNIELHIGDAFVRKNEDNSLSYKPDQTATGENGRAFHTISVPSGKDLHVQLADGSKVWLNTGSTLIFPTAFEKQERRIYLAGEAFFEVASDKQHPFVVENNDFHVRATGTQFNVRAYSDEDLRSATLVEGKVDIEAKRRKQTLEPNQEWAIQSNGWATVNKVDVNTVLGNRDGYFVFNKQDIRQIMKQVSRWYAIDVSYQGTITTKQFGGTFSRTRSLDELIDYLTALGGFQIKKEGRRVIIMS